MAVKTKSSRSVHVNQNAYIASLRILGGFACKHSKMRFLIFHNTHDCCCSLPFLTWTALLKFHPSQFYFESWTPALAASRPTRAGYTSEHHSLKSMIQQLYWTRWEREHVGADSRGLSSHLSTVLPTSLTLPLVFACRTTAPENFGCAGFVHPCCLNHPQTFLCLSESVINSSSRWKYYRNVLKGVMGVMFLLKFAV